MENFFYLIIGSLITYLILQKPLQITVHHKHENIIPQINDPDLQDLENKMLTPDVKNDQLYEDFEKTLEEINNIMGGSDR